MRNFLQLKVMKHSLQIFNNLFNFGRNKFLLLVSVICLFSFLSCDNVLPTPKITASSASNGEKLIMTPSGVKASHGQKGKITITWNAVQDAKYYFIYKADNPYDQYVQIDEAKGDATSKSISVLSGTSGYFKVAAVDGVGNISNMSLAVYGTSLATPVITSITEEGDTAKVYWFMENCSEKSYLSSVSYLVTCYKSDGTALDSKTVTGTNDTVCSFVGLNAGTVYYYDVEACLTTDQGATEKSLKLDYQTAVNMIPKPAEFTATEGTSIEKVTLEITLPPKSKVPSEVTAGTTLYTEYPISFVVERSEKGKNEYVKIVSYLNYKGETVQITDYADYEEGNTFTWEDTGCTRGVQYDYRVTSWIDCYYSNSEGTKKVESYNDPSISKVRTGWRAADVTFGAKNFEYVKVPGTSGELYKKSATLQFEFKWEKSYNKENNYVFVVEQKYSKLVSDNTIGGNTSIIYKYKFIESEDGNFYFNTIADVDELEIKYEFDEIEDSEANKATRGNYIYTVYVVPKESISSIQNLNGNERTSLLAELVNSSLMSKADINSISVNNSMHEPIAPVITLEDGYSNKAKITVTNIASNQYAEKYKIIRYEDVNGELVNPVEIGSEENGLKYISSTEYVDTFIDEPKVNDAKFGLTSGKKYKYVVSASYDGSDWKESFAQSCETLGTPELVFDNADLDYNTIKVTWMAVQKENKYTVKHNNHEYTFDSFDSDQPLTETEYKVVRKTQDGIKYYEFTLSKNIEGFTDVNGCKTIATQNAGKLCNFEVTAIGDRDPTDASSKAKANVKVKVLGPAGINLTKASSVDKDKINFTWNKIDGAEIYAVYRNVKYNPKDRTEEKSEIFYVKADGTLIDSNENIVNNTDQTVVNTQPSTYVEYIDKQYLRDSNDKTQARIAWGLPFTYMVAPVKNLGDDPFTDDTFAVTYTDINSTAIAPYTMGYGMNITATKAEYGDKIVLKWEKPNTYTDSKPVIFCNGVEYVRPSDKKPLELSASAKTCEIYLEKDKNGLDRLKPVEFMVVYDNTLPISGTTYNTYLASDVNKDTDGEQANVGYLLSVANFAAVQQTAATESFTEKVTWQTLYDTDRKKGPTSYTVECLNKNYSSKWKPIATIDVNSREATPIANVESTLGVKVVSIPNGIEITPTIFTGTGANTVKRLCRDSSKKDAYVGTDYGLLMVQRDYKHYYRLVARRQTPDGSVDATAYFGDIDCNNPNDPAGNKENYAFRKISDDEFVKGITLIVADALYQAGIDDGGTREVSGSIGKFHCEHPGASQKFIWGTNGSDYVHKFEGGLPAIATEKLESGWTLNMSNATGKEACTYNYLAYLTWGSIKVTHIKGLASYQGYVILTAGDGSEFNFWGTKVDTEKFNLSIQYSHKLTTLESADKICITPTSWTSYSDSKDTCCTVENNQTNFLQWFPYKLGEDRESSISTYNTSLPLYSGNWWKDNN